MVDSRSDFGEWRMMKIEERELACSRREKELKIREAVIRKKEEQFKAWETKLRNIQQEVDLSSPSESDLPAYGQERSTSNEFDGETVPPPRKAVITSIQLQPSEKSIRGVIEVESARKQVPTGKQQNATRKRKLDLDGVIVEHKRTRKVFYAEAEDNDYIEDSPPPTPLPRKTKKNIKKDENGLPTKADLESVHALMSTKRAPTARELSRAQKEHVKRVNACIEFMLNEVSLLKDMQHFSTLPDEDDDDAAEYYNAVKRPIALAHIQGKREVYTDVLDCTRDLLRIPFNARRFYPAGHPHSIAALRLETQLCDIINRAQVSFGEDLWVFETPDPLEMEAASSLAALADLVISTSQTESESDATDQDTRKVPIAVRPPFKAIYRSTGSPSALNKDCVRTQMEVDTPKRETSFPVLAKAG